MNQALIVFGIQSTLRAAQAGADLYGEHARDRRVFLPNLELPEGSRSSQLLQFLTENPLTGNENREYSDVWDSTQKELKTTNPELIDPAYAFMLEQKAKLLLNGGRDEQDTAREAKMLAAGRMVEQWRADRKPPSALIRMALTLTDIGLEFVSSDPSILGLSSRGEKLIVAFANNMQILLPDEVTAFGPKADFADRVLGVFLRAGLGSLASNASTVFEDEDIAKLIEGVTKPIIDALPENIADQIKYRDLVDALAGPSAEAAFKTLAENTEIYLGKAFADEKALGVVTTALFGQIHNATHNGSIVDAFSEQGLIRLYKVGLGVAVERPGLFIGEDSSVKSRLFRELLSDAATTLSSHPRFKGPVGASLASMVLESVSQNVPALLKLKPDEPWEKVATKTLTQITKGLADALNTLDANGSPKGALKSFSDGQLLEFGRVILAQVSKTPGMLGVDRSEVQSIVAGMAEVMAVDDNLLLSADEWIQITAVASQKAASNPGRLFGISVEDQGGALAVSVIKSVLDVAGRSWSNSGRSDRPLLFGETLEAALKAVIEALSGDITAIVNQPNLVDGLMQKIMSKAATNPEKIGSEGVLKVLNTFIGKVLASGSLPTDQEIEVALLSI